jgi:hypothetical protein
MMEFYRYINYTGNQSIYLETYYLYKETEKGYWISPYPDWDEQEFKWMGDKLRWVSKTSRKRFAYPTKEEALTSFIARKNRQIKLLKTNLEWVRTALDQARKLQNKEVRNETTNMG